MKDTQPWIIPFILFAIAFVLHIGSHLLKERSSERAQFMMICAGEHGYAPATCERIWKGETPPREPDGCMWNEESC